LMPVLIALLRAVNVGGRNMVKMSELQRLCASLGFEDVATYVQSGNLVFRTRLSAAKAAKSLEDGIEKQFGFRSNVIVRTAGEMKEVVARNPFEMEGRDASKLLVLFLASEIGSDVRSRLEAIPTAAGEEVKAFGREVFIYYPEGMGRSKLSAAMDKVLRVSGTGRNWRTVTKLLQMAEELDRS
jgi:uncharacterized protein (DUF1697 family)